MHEARGRDTLEAVFEDSLRAPSHNLPTVHNHRFVIVGDTATGVFWIELHADKDGEEWRGSGYYEDVVRREKGRWKFVLRDSTLASGS